MEKIAIIGMGCLFPGGENPDKFFEVLLANQDATSTVSQDVVDFDPDFYFHPKRGTPDKLCYLKHGSLRNFYFDPDGYDISAVDLENLDSIFQWSLYVARQALNDNGYFRRRELLHRCGIILGNLSFVTMTSKHLIEPTYLRILEPYVKQLMGNPDFQFCGRKKIKTAALLNASTFSQPAIVTARGLSLQGPCLTIDAACASSVYVMELASLYLLSGQADLMLAGAVCRPDILNILHGFNLLHATPQSGESRPLDQNSEGMMVGEGAGMFLLKRYRDAIRDGDTIHAVVESIGWSNDGGRKALLTPSTRGQFIAFERAYKNTELADEVEYIECHATGTELGDSVELTSLERFFGKRKSPPQIGGVKANIGHLLTASAMASMIKVVMAMKRETIPGTIKIESPLNLSPEGPTPFKPVTQNTAWPVQSSKKKVAAVNAFGFGGTNAHIVFSSSPMGRAEPKAKLKKNKPVKLEPIAIIGLGAQFGNIGDQQHLTQLIYDGKNNYCSLPKNRWMGGEISPTVLDGLGLTKTMQPPFGGYLEHFLFDFFRFKIPANEITYPIVHQLLMLKVADQALSDAGYNPKKDSKNIAVLIGTEFDLSCHRYQTRLELPELLRDSLKECDIDLDDDQLAELSSILKESLFPRPTPEGITGGLSNLIANRISSAFDFSGPSFAVGSQENSVYRGLQAAQLMLSDGNVEQVLLGGIGMGGGLENVLWKHRNNKLGTGAKTLSYDREVNGWTFGDGAGVVILKRLDDAIQGDDRIYAVIDGIGTVQQNTSISDRDRDQSAQSVVEACKTAFHLSDCTSNEIGYLEANASGVEQEDLAEIKGLNDVYSSNQDSGGCAIGCVKTNIGHTFSASGIASLIKTSLCLYHRFIPPTLNWSSPKHPELWKKGPFYIDSQARPWFRYRNMGKRRAAINGIGTDQSYTHIILSEPEKRPTNLVGSLDKVSTKLFPLGGHNRNDLKKALKELRKQLERADSLIHVADSVLARYQANSSLPPFSLSIIGSTPTQVMGEIDQAMIGLDQAFSSDSDWVSKFGSCFSPKPLGQVGKVAFVYPMAGPTNPETAQRLLFAFPHLFTLLESKDTVFYQKSKTFFGYSSTKNYLAGNQKGYVIPPLKHHFSLSLIHELIYNRMITELLKNAFGIHPHMVLGCSFGELSMIDSVLGLKTDDVKDENVMTEAIQRICETIRNKDTPNRYFKEETIDWKSYFVRAPVDFITSRLQNEHRVFIAIICSPAEVIISGHRPDCERVIQEFGNLKYPIEDIGVVHTPVANSLLSTLKSIIQKLPLRLNGDDNTVFYSGVDIEPMSLTEPSIIENYSRCLCETIDFSSLVKRCYQDGARIFVDMGPQDHTTRWIQNTLASLPHVAIPINPNKGDEDASVVAVLARLMSHRVPINLSGLRNRSVTMSSEKTFIKRVVNGYTPLHESLLSKENMGKLRSSSKLEDVRHAHENKASTPLLQDEPAAQYQTTQHENCRIAAGADSAFAGGNGPKSLPCNPPTQMNVCWEDIMNNNALVHIHYLQLQEWFHRILGESFSSIGPSQTRESDWPPETDRLSVPNPHSGLTMEFPKNGEKRGTVGVVSTDMSTQASNLAPTPKHKPSNKTPNRVIWDETDIIEMTNGKLSNVLGSDYMQIDSYPIRTRMPSPPFMFVSRVTHLEAEKMGFKPSSIEWEYDIPENAWYVADGSISSIAPIESSHASILLLSYLGCDFIYKGERRYRVLDASVVFHDELPRPGDTIRGRLAINSFVKSKGNMLVFYEYQCFLGRQLIFTLNASGGFFSSRDVEESRGIVIPASQQKKNAVPSDFRAPFMSNKTAFNGKDIQAIQQGNLNACFGYNAPKYPDVYPPMLLGAPRLLMIDRVLSVDPFGGPAGLGIIVAEKDIHPDHWAFKAHFKNDPVLPGTLIAEGTQQLLLFYLYYLGIPSLFPDSQIRIKVVKNIPAVSKFRGQVKQTESTLLYRITIKRIELEPFSYILGDAEVVYEGKIILWSRDVAIGLASIGSPKNDENIQPFLLNYSKEPTNG